MTLSSETERDHIDNPDKIDNKANPLDSEIQRLAALPPLEYDRLRKTESKTLGVRIAVLDKAVEDARSGKDNNGLPFPEVTPWPHPVNPPQLLTEIASTVQRFIICNKEVSHAATLWIAMTWFIDVVHVAPLAFITAPEKRCGKTIFLSLLGRLVARSIIASNISPAALFRAIEAWSPTLLIDEADAFMKNNEELRGLLNSGHTRDSAYTIRNVGENFTPTNFSTWGAKAIAGIGHVADTLMDRAIILELRRKRQDEMVERMRYAEPSLFCDLQAKLARFADDYSDTVREARPPLPSSLNDRAQDNWEPLLAIAMTAGPEWLKLGITAALKLSGGESSSQTIGTELLLDIQEIFEQKKIERISTADLIQALCADNEKRWATYFKGNPITPRELAGQLKRYGIKSKSIRIGVTTPKGYEKDQFTEAFTRYLPSSPDNIRHTPQPAPAEDLTVADEKPQCETAPIPATAEVKDDPPSCGYKTEGETLKPSSIKECCAVADGIPLPDSNILA